MSSFGVGCIPVTPVGNAIRDNGWKTLAAVDTTTIAQYEPLSTTVLTFENMFATEKQSAILRQLRVRIATAATYSTMTKALIIYLYTDAAPTAPTLGAVYSASTTNLIGIVRVPAANFERVGALTTEAYVNTNRYIKSGTASTATTIYAVVLADEAIDYDGAPTVDVFMETELCS